MYNKQVNISTQAIRFVHIVEKSLDQLRTKSHSKALQAFPLFWWNVTFEFDVYHSSTGYYRVNYDNETWSAIADRLQTSPSSINVLNRAQVNTMQITLTPHSTLSGDFP